MFHKKGGIPIDKLLKIALVLAVVVIVILFLFKFNFMKLLNNLIPGFESEVEKVESDVKIKGEGIYKYNDEHCPERTVALIYEETIYFCDEEKYCSYPIESNFVIKKNLIMFFDKSFAKDIVVGTLNNEGRISISDDFLDLDSWVYQSQRFSSEKIFNLEDFVKIHLSSFNSDTNLFCKKNEDKLKEELVNQKTWPEEEGIQTIEIDSKNVLCEKIKRGLFLSLFLNDKILCKLDLSKYDIASDTLYLENEKDFISIKVSINKEYFGRVYPDNSVWLERNSIHNRRYVSNWGDVKWIKRDFEEANSYENLGMLDSYERLHGTKKSKIYFNYETNLRINYNELKGILKNEK